jgi:hypothetical protein
MKDVVVGAISGYDWPQISVWANSLCDCGFEGDKIVLTHRVSDRALDILEIMGFQVFRLEPDDVDIKIHGYRFQRASKLLRFASVRYRPTIFSACYRHMIFTDVRDIVFQTNPSFWIEGYLDRRREVIVAQSEGVAYKDEEWNRENLKETFGTEAYNSLKDQVVINCGCMAGESGSMLDLFQKIGEKVEAGHGRIVDQAAANLIIRSDEYREKVLVATADMGYVAQLGTTANHKLHDVLVEESPVFEWGHVFTQNGHPFCMVHQYDRVPGLREEIYAKYWEA